MVAVSDLRELQLDGGETRKSRCYKVVQWDERSPKRRKAGSIPDHGTNFVNWAHSLAV